MTPSNMYTKSKSDHHLATPSLLLEQYTREQLRSNYNNHAGERSFLTSTLSELFNHDEDNTHAASTSSNDDHSAILHEPRSNRIPTIDNSLTPETFVASIDHQVF